MTAEAWQQVLQQTIKKCLHLAKVGYQDFDEDVDLPLSQWIAKNADENEEEDSKVP